MAKEVLVLLRFRQLAQAAPKALRGLIFGWCSADL
jgi:hypothetical protein